MRRAHRPLAAVIAVLVVAAGLAAAGHNTGTRGQMKASASDRNGGRGFDVLPSSVAAPADLQDPGTGTQPAAPPPPTSPDEVALQSFSGCESLLDHVRSEGVARVTAYGLPTPGGSGARLVAEAAGDAQGGAAASSTASGGSADASYSTTNVQEGGVDEPDVVKNDGSRVFTAVDGLLRSHVVDEDGLRLGGTVELPSGFDVELLLIGERLVAIGRARAWDAPLTRLQIYDVADPDAFALVNDLEVDGRYVSSRSADGIARIVTTTSPDFPFVSPDDGSAEAQARALTTNRSLLADSSVGDWIPEITELPTQRVSAAVPCTAMRATSQFSGFNTTTVLTLDPVTGTFGETASVLSDAHEVYASAHHLYVATAAWPEAEADQSWPAPQETQIHQFDISDPTRAVYTASGVVSGHLIRPFLWGGASRLAQWALSEHAGHLRVASTVGAPGDDAAVSSVTVLRRTGAVLQPVGAVGGLGAGERVYAVRFMGHRGYVVTYRTVDPLYVIDLAEPSAPKVLGELKVPGFSAYLHPVGDGLLVGVGQEDANEDGMVEGLQVSLFDVTDPTAPKQLDRLHVGGRGMTSVVESDPRAFTWWPHPARAVLPVTSWHPDDVVGAIGIGVGDGRLAEIGRVAHPSADDADCRFLVLRSRVVDGTLYTFSAGGVWSNAIEDFEPQATLRYDDVRSTCHRSHEPEPEPPPSTTTTTTPRPLPLP